MQNHPVIAVEKCTGCGLCVQICPLDVFALEGGRATARGHGCIGCDHCVAVCPARALDLEFDAVPASYRKMVQGPDWLTSGTVEVGRFLKLLHSRRSCRAYLSKEIDPELLEDLVTCGCAAPSGTNSQGCVYTVLRSRSEVLGLGRLVANFYRRLNSLAERRIVRLIDRIFGAGKLGVYYLDHYRSVRQALLDFDEKDRDRLFHGAPAVIAVSAQDSASCPQEDALLATANILLASHAAGLGSCMIGYAVEAGQRDRKIRNFLQLSEREKLYAVIALGYPAVSFLRITRRKKPIIRSPIEN